MTSPVIVEVAVVGATPRHARVRRARHAALVDGGVELLADLGRRPATTTETRAILGVPGHG